MPFRLGSGGYGKVFSSKALLAYQAIRILRSA
jgi:hypothetical protein